MVRVAAVQVSSVAFDLRASVAKLKDYVSQAKEGGAKLVVFPEAFLSGYPRHLNFCIGARTPESRQWYSKYVASSVKIPDNAEGRDVEDTGDEEFWAFAELSRAAKEAGVFISAGIIERSLVGSTVWCTNVLFGPTGVLLSRHRKLQPTAAERVIWSQGEATIRHADGTTSDNLPVVKTDIGNIGGLVCWENLMPLARYVLYRKGVEIYTAPTADARTTWLPSMQHIAQEGRCFVISVNQYCTWEDYPSDYIGSANADKGVWSRGGSCIVGPLGEVLAGPLWDEEGILYADVDVESLAGAKLDFDPVGHYAREEVLKDLVGVA